MSLQNSEQAINEEPRYQGNFTQIPNEIIFSNLTSSELKVYLGLVGYYIYMTEEEALPSFSMQAFSKRLHMPKSLISKTFQKLVDKKLVQIQEITNENGASSIYTILKIPQEYYDNYIPFDS